ncbi:hypothetical protein AB835_02545 [Candidatus Endobugula sertula]|uniref:Insecticidal toxin complex protein TccC n=1 Tax=Candidatus Endobugula sertula TaxID=62101 RepID=A0A1D2QSS9_9GAMM|nr:hypothetical protein AB835_02545 [Candidatus Endobugula sertula]
MPTTMLHSGTPEISVVDNRRAAIRTLRYQRKDIAEEVNERIERYTFSPLGHLASTIDARFFTNNTACNFQYQHDLSGKALRTDSVDAGSSYVFYDIEGKPLWQQDARATQQHYDYDLLGRHTERRETLAGETSAVRERFCYGDSGEINDDGRKNLRGQLAKHYDTAGLLDYSVMGYGLESSPLQQQRQLLPIETDSDWQGSDANGWQQALTGDTYTTGWRYAADGQVLQQTDTKGHQQRSSYDVMGRLKASSVTLNGDSEQSVLTAVSYNAAGRKLREQAANHIVTDYSYEPETQRLLGMTTTRGNTRLQQWHYSYDPVGNITALANAAEVDSYFNNQQATAVRHYQYDTLYQLISASGRENPGQSSVIDNPAAIVPPPDSGQYVPYTRNYQYDAGGNLTQIQHQADNHHYTRTLRVSAHSNHAILDTSTVTRTVGHIEEAFDACGNQQQLDTGQRLLWDGLNQLQRVTTIARDSSEDDDRESYSYGADGMRVRKTGTTQASGGNTLQQQDVIYLPGIELRRTHSNQVVTEHLEVITIGAAGRSQVRLLHWLDGTEPDAIANRQWRYSLDDHLGSSHLELDDSGNILTKEEYYAYGGTAVRTAKSTREVKYKTIRYSGKERDSSGLYYYGYRYYQPWLGRWLNTDPAGTVDGLNVYRMVRNNPVRFFDKKGLNPDSDTEDDELTVMEAFEGGADFIKDKAQAAVESVSEVFSEGAKVLRQTFRRPIRYLDMKSKGIATGDIPTTSRPPRSEYLKQQLPAYEKQKQKEREQRQRERARRDRQMAKELDEGGLVSEVKRAWHHAKIDRNRPERPESMNPKQLRSADNREKLERSNKVRAASHDAFEEIKQQRQREAEADNNGFFSEALSDVTRGWKHFWAGINKPERPEPTSANNMRSAIVKEKVEKSNEVREAAHIAFWKKL